MRSWIVLLACVASAQTTAVPDRFFFAEGKLRALILTGRNNHEWRVTTPHLRQVLEASGRFDVRVTEEPAGLTAATLKPYDVLIANYCGPRWRDPAETAVREFVAGGKGLVVVHAASYPFGETAVLSEHQGRTDVFETPWKEWGDMVGAAWSDAEPKTGHARRHAYQVKWQDAQHPVAAGMNPSFLLSDELYHNFRMRPGVHVIASAIDAPEMGGNGKLEPLIWTNDYGRGHVFHTALGHDLDAMQAPGFIASYVRGAEWAASGKVTLPAAIDTDPKDPRAVRVLLVTGGHDHEASFYAALDHRAKLRVNVDPHPAAFRGDLRKAYDVVVLYDMIPELPDAYKKNVQDFLESGKGMVVLHHSLATFQKWDWWWRDVVGGRYLEKSEPNFAAATYKHDVEMVVTPTGDHPIIKGLPQMRVFDESYHGVWHADGIIPLLTTNEATSDPVVAWISPYAKSRVAVVQLGHGRPTHESPWYQELVERAIEWAAGRR